MKRTNLSDSVEDEKKTNKTRFGTPFQCSVRMCVCFLSIFHRKFAFVLLNAAIHFRIVRDRDDQCVSIRKKHVVANFGDEIV